MGETVSRCAVAALFCAITGCRAATPVADVCAGVPQFETTSQNRAWGDVPLPIVIGHRGAAAYVPENTVASWDEAASLGVPLETDVHVSADGVPVCIHDPTVDRTTDGTGRVVDKRLAELQRLNASKTIPGYPPTRIPTLTEYLCRYAGRLPVIAEVKTGTLAVQVPRAVTRLGFESSVVIASFSGEDLAAARAVNPNIRTLLATPSAIDPGTIGGLGIWAIAPHSASVTTQWVAECHAAGIKVLPYTVNDVALAEALVNGNGVDGVLSDDPGYIQEFLNKSTQSRKRVVVPARIPASGWGGSMTGFTLGVVGGVVTFPGATASAGANNVVLPPLRAPESAYQIDTSITLVSKADDPGRYIGVRFAWSRDRDYAPFGPAGSGYHFAYRADGTVELARDTAGASLLLHSATWTALVEGEVVPLRIDVTADSVSVVRTDTGQTVTVADSTPPRGGWFAAFGATSVVGLGNSTLAY